MYLNPLLANGQQMFIETHTLHLSKWYGQGLSIDLNRPFINKSMLSAYNEFVCGLAYVQMPLPVHLLLQFQLDAQ